MEIKSKEIKIVDIDSIIPNPKNPNRHSKDQIKRLSKLIKQTGFRNPLVISNQTGFLVVGHGRLEAAKELGMTSVPVIYQDFQNEADEYAYVVSDNAIASWSELDLNSITKELENFPNFDIEMFGLKSFEIEQPEEKKEEKPVEISFNYKIEVDCKDEETQQYLKAELEDRGLKVRLLI